MLMWLLMAAAPAFALPMDSVVKIFAVQSSPDYFAPRFNLALLREKSGDDEAAIALYEEALAIDPGHGAAGRNLAALISRRGRGGELPLRGANKP